MDETQYTPEQLAQLQSDNDEFDFVMNDDSYNGYNPYVGSTSDAEMYDAATNNEGATENDNTTPLTAPTQPTQTTPLSATATISTPEKDAYEKAFSERNDVNAENLRSFRDLLDYYKPETPEEREKRERMERTRQNIVGFSNMAAALGNLASAASSKDGRSVKVEPSSDDLDKAIQRERGLREARDAKGIQLRNQYMSLRKQMADENLKTTWQAYMQRQAQEQAAKKLELDYAKAKSADAFKAMQIANTAQANKDRADHWKRMENIARIAAENKKESGSNKGMIPIPYSKGTININEKTINHPITQGELISLLPKSFFSDEDYKILFNVKDGTDVNNPNRLPTDRRDANNAMYGETAMNYIGKYLRDGGIQLPPNATDEQKRDEDDRWSAFMDVLKRAGAEFVDVPTTKLSIYPSAAKEKKHRIMDDTEPVSIGNWSQNPQYTIGV